MGQKRILVVDDEDVLRELLADILSASPPATAEGESRR
jgi:hypothetical protein